jgi:SpoIID/LytB domain protein
MPPLRTTTIPLALLALLALPAGLVPLAVPAVQAQEQAQEQGPAPVSEQVSEQVQAPVTLRIPGGVRFVTGADGLIRVAGVGGASAGLRFLDTVELLPRRGGIEVVNELGFDDYLYGLAEVPRSWPEAVLEAQVIAARTYAWHVMGRSTYADYDICATTACQVFRGAEVLLADGGERWRAAVDATSGQTLLYDGAPILARYFSTSGGRTYPNEVVFPSSGPRPYLVGIEDPYDALSPVHRWEVRFLRSEFNALLAGGETLSAVAPYERIERLGAVDDTRAMIRITGRDGRSVEVRAIVLRDFLSTRAPLLFPARFPPLRADGERPLPSTLPTTRYAIEVTNFEVVFSGLGWGHGVGMGQWGAHARALEGADASEILAAYYNGVRPTQDARVPSRIRAGMGAAALDDGLGLPVTLLSPTELVGLDGRTLAMALGTWRVARELDEDGVAVGSTLLLSAPAGWGEPFVITPTRARALPARDDEPAIFDVRAVLSGPTLLRLVVTGPDGEELLERDLGVLERGLHVTSWQAVDASGAPLPAGSYTVALLGSDAEGTSAGSATTVELVAATEAGTDPVPGTDATDAVADADAVTDGDPAAATSMQRITDAGLGAGLVVAVLLVMLASVTRSRLRRRRDGRR